jgi:hypothetical protein
VQQQKQQHQQQQWGWLPGNASGTNSGQQLAQQRVSPTPQLASKEHHRQHLLQYRGYSVGAQKQLNRSSTWGSQQVGQQLLQQQLGSLPLQLTLGQLVLQVQVQVHHRRGAAVG